MITVTVISVVISAALSWYRAQEAEYLRQQRVEDRLREFWGMVEWEQRAPIWLRWTGDWQVCQRIGRIHYAVGAFNAVITELKGISTEYELVAFDEDLTGPTVERLKGLKGLRRLDVFGRRSSKEPEKSGDNYIRMRTNDLRRSLPGVEVSVRIEVF